MWPVCEAVNSSGILGQQDCSSAGVCVGGVGIREQGVMKGSVDGAWSHLPLQMVVLREMGATSGKSGKAWVPSHHFIFFFLLLIYLFHLFLLVGG